MKKLLIALFICVSSVLYATSDTLMLFDIQPSYLPFKVVMYQTKGIKDSININITGYHSTSVEIIIWNDNDLKCVNVSNIKLTNTNFTIKLPLSDNKPNKYRIQLVGNKDGMFATNIKTK